MACTRGVSLVSMQPEKHGMKNGALRIRLHIGGTVTLYAITTLPT